MFKCGLLIDAQILLMLVCDGEICCTEKLLRKCYDNGGSGLGCEWLFDNASYKSSLTRL